ncbi:photosystem II S4 domain protein [Desulfohalotomaculum tongense]|uniref:photosystem II S4 domain protein n=1 Tax=Desulforadius tongensis TaxID=1216062 RepID=UPI001957D653|nr:photosystem II S4 domain protein [Desulforadius tongensis]MBM7855244.1 photosystem II S4 domain protein [Desulforadius tongensis]
MVLIDREKLLNSYAGTEERALLARAIDLAEKVLKNHRPLVTDFYDPYHTGLVFSLLNPISDIEITADGGYPDAERTRVIIYPDYMLPEQLDSQLAFLVVEGNCKMAGVTHRDYLGSLTGLGLKRDRLGDIIVGEKGAQLVVDAGVAPYIRANLTKVGRVKVNVREITREQLQLPAPKIKVINATVASMRLDAVAAAGYGTSRSKLVREIKAERLNINWCPCSNPSAPVKEGDMLSLRGRGRVKVAAVKGSTKKGRIALVLHKYL